MDREILEDVVEYFRDIKSPSEKEQKLLAEIEKHELVRFPIAYVTRDTIGDEANELSDEEMREFAGHMGDSYCDSLQYVHDLETAKGEMGI